MIRLGGFLVNQSKALLENRLHALLCVAFFTVMPFTGWLAAALMALVVFRKGEEAGVEALIVAVTLSSIVMIINGTSASLSLFQSLIDFVPCFIAASVLRHTRSWRLALGSIFLQTALVAWLIPIIAPDFIPGLFIQMKILMSDFDNMSHINSLLNAYTKDNVGDSVIAHLFFSATIVSFALMSVVSLLFARFMQAKCFNPGGFKQEVLGFRSGKIALLLLPCLYFAASSQVLLAIDLLPLVLTYFLAAGISLAYFILTEKKRSGMMIFMVLSLFVKPIIMFPVYIIFGSLDSLFNFRVYLLAKAGKSV